MRAARTTTTTATAAPDTTLASPTSEPTRPDTTPTNSTRPDTTRIKLSTGQLNLLRSFAGHTLTPPRAIHTSTYNTLTTHGLIERHTPRSAYRITQYGKRVAARLYPDDSPPHPPR
jgi:hypothetical protein